tara:strand:+ start:1015 stop:1761 length:747 start_codon:yes stop_codon:yes gene_type:complete
MNETRNEMTKILIVEDDMIIGANISLQLTNLGYEVTGIVSRGEEAVAQVKDYAPDILLMDINLKGKLNGIETAKAIQKSNDIPLVYLTANADEATFVKARETHPHAFISKPFNALDLQRTIALVAERLKDKSGVKIKEENPVEVLNDRVFVRHNGKMSKLLLDDILYVEAERNYCNIVTAQRGHLLSSTLKTMEEKLPETHFLRIHRSFVINISKLDVVAESHIEINRKVIPLSKSHRSILLSRIQTV